MPRYRMFGGLDDPRVDDGDIGFRGVNLRLPAWQLESGMLSLSVNGRIDGEWVPRRGCDVVSAESLENGSPLRLPFFVTDSESGLAISAASRVGEVVTLTVTGHGFDIVSGGAVSATLDPSGANNGIYLEAASGILSGVVSCEIAVSVDSAATTCAVVGNKITVTSGDKNVMVVSGGTMWGNAITWDALIFNPLYDWWEGTAEVTDADFNTYSVPVTLFLDEGQDNAFQLNISEAAWLSSEQNETFPSGLTYVTTGGSSGGTPTVSARANTGSEVFALINATGSASSLVTASNASGSTGAGTIAAVSETFLFGNTLGESAYIAIEGLGFTTTDPNGVYLLTPTDANTLTYSIPGASGSETYTIGGGNDIIVARLDDTVSGQVLGSCIFSDPNSDNAESIYLAFETVCKVVDLSDGSVSEIGYPSGEVLEGDVSMIQAFDKVQIFRGGKVAMEWATGDTDFALVRNGNYSQPQVLSSNGSAISIADGLVTFTVTGNTTIEAGDALKIYSATDTRFTDVVGSRYQVVSASSTEITCYIGLPDSASGSNTVQIGKNVSIGGGFIHQPGFPWAVHFQRRLWGPYSYRWDTSLTPDAFTARGVSDELIVSDIMDADTYDAIQNQFRITGGTADYIVGVHPFYDDTLLVFNRNSVHAVSGTVGSLADVSVRELTREVGCVSRKSIATQGNSVFFLSDNGVYGLSFVDQYNLRGVDRPLSEAVQPYIDRISWGLANKAVGRYFDNRYWLAVPLDSEPRAGDASGNNAILVFNLLNQQWESVDTFGDPNFLIMDLLIGSSEARNDLYAVTTTGGIHVLNKLDADYDVISTDPSSTGENVPIDAAMRTRSYICGTTERKRFAEFYVQAKGGSAQSDLEFTFSTDDPDNSSSTVTANSLIGDNIDPEDTADMRGRIGGVRGFNGALQISRVIGRPAIRGIRVSGTMTNRQTVSHT